MKQRQSRIPIRIPVRVISHSSTGDRSDDGICTDINECGTVELELEVNLDMTNSVELEFVQNHRAVFHREARLLYRCRRKYGAYLLQL
jgi:hypothetical protein